MSYNDPYFGFGLKDKNGNVLSIGDDVLFMGEKQTLRLVKWEHYAYPNTTKRIQIGKTSMWLVPSTAIMCEKINVSPSNQKPLL